MTNFKTLAVAIILLAVSVFSNAQSKDERSIKEVVAMDEKRVAALLNRDTETLKKIYADSYTLVTENGSVQTKLFRLPAIASGQLAFEKIEIVDRNARAYGDTVVIVSREKLTIKLDGKPAGGDVRVTGVYRRFGNRWLAVASHASAIR